MDNNFLDKLKEISGDSALITGKAVTERQAGIMDR